MPQLVLMSSQTILAWELVIAVITVWWVWWRTPDPKRVDKYLNSLLSQLDRLEEIQKQCALREREIRDALQKLEEAVSKHGIAQ